jgi:hypothetical protein
VENKSATESPEQHNALIKDDIENIGLRILARFICRLHMGKNHKKQDLLTKGNGND